MNIGNSDIVTSYLGNSEILRTYLGNRLIQISSNNNIPDFIGTNVFTVVEGGTEACTIAATDPSNVGIKFYIIGGEDELQFQLDADTGVLSFIDVTSFGIPTDTDYAGYNTYFVLIRVIDNADKYRDRMYSIEVTQDNSIPLTILLDTATLTENSDIGTIIGEFSINEDTGYVFSFTNDLGANDNLFFDIVDSSLVSAAILNFDVKDKYYVHVKAEKSGETTLKKPFTITIENVVEAPIDILISKNTIIDENNNIGDVIATLSIVNAESTTTSTIYAVVDELDGDHFLIIGNTIYANIVFNFTTQLIHQLTVSATNSSGTINKTFTFIVRNINDAPIFATETKTFKIYEGNLAIGTILATDIDNQPLTYSINQGLDSNKFSINSSSGVLSFNPLSFSTTGNAPNYDFPLDIDGNNRYECVVKASDGSLFDTQIIYVDIYNVGTKNLYVATNGIDVGNTSGDISHPFFSIATAMNYAYAGDTIYVRTGTYNYTVVQKIENKNGSSGNPITIRNYPGEFPLIRKSTVSFDSINTACLVYISNCSYINLYGLEIAYNTQTDVSQWPGLKGIDINNCRWELLKCHDSGIGAVITGNSSNNYVINSDFYNNHDPLTAHASGDGLDISTIFNQNAINYVDGCRFWDNSDDGLDFFENDGYVEVTNSWMFWNGYTSPAHTTFGGDGHGVKLGGYHSYITPVDMTTIVKRTFKNCLAFENISNGITLNTHQVKVRLHNVTTYNNRRSGGGFYTGIDLSSVLGVAHEITNCISANTTWVNNRKASVVASAIVTTSSFVLSSNGDDYCTENPIFPVANYNFLSTDSTGVDGARQADGSLPVLDYLKLTFESCFKDAGTDVGLPKIGVADVGAYEFYPSAINVAPVFVETITYDVVAGNTYVGTALATDANGDTVSYLKIGGADQLLFSINSGTGVITFNSPPSYNIGGDNTYELIIRASDGTLFDDLTITITVTPSATLLSGLISAWEFDETTGTTLVDKVGSNDLTASSSDILNHSIVLSPTVTITGLFFNKTLDTDYLTAVHRSNMDTLVWTVAGWISPSARNNYNVLFQKADATTGNNGFAIYTSYNKLWVNIADNIGSVDCPLMASLSELAIGTIYHILISYSANTLKLYINGSLMSTVTSTKTMMVSTGGLVVGADIEHGTKYGGVLGKLYWWNKELDQASIDVLYNGGNGTFYPFE